ncbi:EF-hand domain-containing protein [Agaribacter flavus]|uniref:EF-hand domain-containing protein n=1 Tax=Agaribacter flavus TaxID=1902781 RepID=A0ABV7FSD1_9ALTE
MSILTKKMIMGTLLTFSCVMCFASSDLFESLDIDDSGTISVTEASVHSVLNEMFTTLDENADGELSFEEFSKAGLEQ